MHEYAIRCLSSLLLIAVFLFSSCAGGKQIRLKTVRSTKKITGLFSVIFHGTANYDWMDTIAFLDVEGDDYELEPYVPEFDYAVQKNVEGEKAVAKALHFVSSNVSFQKAETSSILNEKGDVIGYEVRPFYRPFVFGVTDVLEVYYWLMDDGRVKVTIDVIPSLKHDYLRESEGDS